MSSQISGDILTSIKQCPTPLNNLFFSEFNQNLLQRAIREKFLQQYQIKIDYQDKNDLIAVMRVMYMANYANPYGDLCQQVKFINEKVIQQCIEQISTGVSQYYGYMNDLSKPIEPPAIPTNTSVYGNNSEARTRTIGF